MMKMLRQEPYFYVLFRDEELGEYFLEVTCGTSAVFELRVRLSRQEIKHFLENPDSIEHLAYQILDSPGSFLNRKI